VLTVAEGEVVEIQKTLIWGGVIAGTGSLILNDSLWDYSGGSYQTLISSINVQINSSATFNFHSPQFELGGTITINKNAIYITHSDLTFLSPPDTYSIINYGNIVFNWTTGDYDINVKTGIENSGNISFRTNRLKRDDPYTTTVRFWGPLKQTDTGFINFNVYGPRDADLLFYDIYNTNKAKDFPNACSFSGKIVLNFKYTPKSNDNIPVVQYEPGGYCQGSFEVIYSGLTDTLKPNILYDQKRVDNSYAEYYWYGVVVICDATNSTCLEPDFAGTPTATSSTGPTSGPTTTGPATTEQGGNESKGTLIASHLFVLVLVVLILFEFFSISHLSTRWYFFYKFVCSAF